MNTYKLAIPLHMNMNYVRLVMEYWHQTKTLALTEDMLFVEYYADTKLEEELDCMWHNQSPEGSVGFADFLQTFGA
jgi:hypothetical protein